MTMQPSKIHVVCPRCLVTEAWLKLAASAGWSDTKSSELREEFFRLTVERAGKKNPEVKFPSNFVFSRSYKTHVARFLVVAHYAPIYNDDKSVSLHLTQFGAYLKIYESEKLQINALDTDTYSN